MRLYIYSSTSCTLTRTYWLRAWYALVGGLIGSILFFSIIAIDYFVVKAQGNRTTYALRAENTVLQRYMHLTASRVAAIELQAQRLHDRNLALRAAIAQGDYAEQRLFTLINKVTTLDSFHLSFAAAQSSGPQHQKP